jgi:glycosyltransferase involved in cell wall biosynthesis
LNILFLSQENPYPPDGGHYIRTYNILKLLAVRHDIFFIAVANNNERLKNISQLKNICNSVDIFLTRQGNSKLKLLLSLSLNIFSRLPFTAQKNYIDEVRIKIKQLINNFKIDLVHVDILPLAVYHQDFGTLPKILVNHNVESLRLYRWMKIEKNLFKKVFLFYQYTKLCRFEKQMCLIFNRCIVVSEPDCKTLEEMSGAKNFVTLPNGVDTDYFRPKNNQRIIDKSLIWVGGMRYAYNSDAVNYFLDEIFPLIRSRIPDIKVFFIGGSPTSKLIKNSKSNPQIKVLGYVDDIRRYMDQTSVFIAPIRSGSGTKIKVLNALALEKPVVTTSIGAEGIKVNPDEDIMIGDTSQEFAFKTIYLLENPLKAKYIGKSGRKVIEKYYSWEKIGQMMYNIYDDVRHTNI